MISGLDWRELSADEILVALGKAAATSGDTCTGYLDTHQWLELGSHPDITVVADHPDAQFRRACIKTSPESSIFKLQLLDLQQNVRSPRALRRFLEQQAGNPSLLGELVVSGEAAWFSLAEPESLAESGLKLEAVSGWNPPETAPSSASVASLRLDAVVSRLFNVSRSESQVAITHGFVFVDFALPGKTARALVPGNNVVFRGKGRAKLLSAAPNTRSGRVNLAYRLWPV